MRSNLAESLYAAFVHRVDPILAAGAWPSGEPLTDEDLAWIISLGHIIRLELFRTARRDELRAPSESELRLLDGNR